MGAGKKKNETVTNVTRNVPEWVEKEGQNLFHRASSTTAQGAGNRIYPGQRVAPMNGLQNQAMQAAGETYGKYEPQANDVSAMLKQQYGQGPAQVGTGKNAQGIQFNRFTGTQSDPLFNAYHEKIYNPAAAELNREAERGQTAHTRQNAFGNKRFGSNFVLGQNELEKNRLNQLQNLGANVFGQAMQTFQGEEARNLASQQAQAGINEQDLTRKLQADLANQTAGMQNKQMNISAANAMMNNILSKYNMNANDIARLMGIGQAGQAQDQKQIEAEMQKFNEMNNYDRLELEWLAKFLAQNPGGQMTSTSTTPRATPNTGLQAAGLGVPLISNFLS